MRLVAVVAVVACAACGPRLLPPPELPSRALPFVEDPGPSPPGARRVLIDAVGTHARVTETAGVTTDYVTDSDGNQLASSSLIEHPVCVTPCAVDLTYGAHELMLRDVADPERQASAVVEVGAHPLAVRSALGRSHMHRGLLLGGALLLSVGAASAMSGGIFAAIDAHEPAGAASSSFGTAGWAVLGVGVAAIVAGITLMVLGRSDVQPGATNIWALPDR